MLTVIPVLLIWIDTVSICLCKGFSAPKDDKLMVSNLYGVNATSFASFSVRKDRCDPSSNSILASICRSVPTIVAIAVFSRQVVFLGTLCGTRVVKEAVSTVAVDGGAVSLVVWLVLLISPLVESLQILV